MPQEDSEVWDSHLRVVPSNASPAIGLSLLCGDTHSQVLSGSLTQGHQSLQESCRRELLEVETDQSQGHTKMGPEWIWAEHQRHSSLPFIEHPV